jgi:putative ABC transport system permease protein
MSQGELQLVAAAAFAVIAVSAAWALRLGLSREMAWAAARAADQLTVVGGAVTAATITGRRLLVSLEDQEGETEARLSLGDDAGTALRPVLKRTVTTGLVPVIGQTRSAGLVLLVLLAVERVSALILGRLLLAAVIAPGEHVMVPRRS